MRDEGDFSAYVEARWPVLVRCLVLLGTPVTESVEVAERALARCRLDWRAIRSAEDIDVEVYAVLLAEQARVDGDAPAELVSAARGGAGGWDPFSRPGPALTARPVDAVLVRDALLAALDRLPPDVRRVVVLRHGAGLSAVQVAELLGLDPQEVEDRDASGVAELDPEGLVRQCQ